MTCLELFNVVCALLGEDPDDTSSLPIKKRIPTLVSTAYSMLCSLDRTYRACKLGEDAPTIAADVTSLTSAVPVCRRLEYALATYVAALAVRDENMSLAELLVADTERLVKEVTAELPATVGRVIDVYE